MTRKPQVKKPYILPPERVVIRFADGNTLKLCQDADGYTQLLNEDGTINITYNPNKPMHIYKAQ